MLKNRTITIGFGKKNEKETPEASETTVPLEEKAETILRTLEGYAAKMFLGVCVYVILDTRRQVAVARAQHPEYR